MSRCQEALEQMERKRECRGQMERKREGRGRHEARLDAYRANGKTIRRTDRKVNRQKASAAKREKYGKTRKPGPVTVKRIDPAYSVSSER